MRAGMAVQGEKVRSVCMCACVRVRMQACMGARDVCMHARTHARTHALMRKRTQCAPEHLPRVPRELHRGRLQVAGALDAVLGHQLPPRLLPLVRGLHQGTTLVPIPPRGGGPLLSHVLVWRCARCCPPAPPSLSWHAVAGVPATTACWCRGGAAR